MTDVRSFLNKPFGEYSNRRGSTTVTTVRAMSHLNVIVSEHALWRAAERLGRSVGADEIEDDVREAIRLRSVEYLDHETVTVIGKITAYVVVGHANCWSVVTTLPVPS
jgi:hypothetical protein